MLYIGRTKKCAINISSEKLLQCKAKHTTCFIPGIIIPTQSVIAYVNYTPDVKKPEVVTSKNYKFLISRVPDILHWESIKSLTCQQFLCEAVTITEPKSEINPSAFFVAKVDNPISQEDEVVGHYTGISKKLNFNCPVYGLGTTETWFSRSESDSYLETLKALVLYDSKIYQVTKYSVLCCYSIPKLCHYTLPELKWGVVSDGNLPSNLLPAGIAPNGETLYVGRTHHTVNLLAPGYVVPSEKCLHLGWGCQEYCYDNKFEVLKLDKENIFEWGVYSRGDVPPNAAVVGHYKNEKIFIGRTVIDSDISLGRTRNLDRINLPEDRVSNTQLVGKLQYANECLYVPWNSKEYLYQLYEVLMVKIRPKSLQELCCNVIITATLAIPGRVDKLALPKHLKEFCKLINQVQVYS